MKDPTANEMRDYLNRLEFEVCEFNSSDIEMAIYCFAYNFNSGPDSNLYSALSTSNVDPTKTKRGPIGLAKTAYWLLFEEFAQ